VGYSKEDFGPDFHWGVSTAAYQIEGAHHRDGKGHSIWDRFVRIKGKVIDNTSGDVSCNHYDLFAEDIDIMSQLNITNYRFSLAWSRILPEGIGSINH